MAVAVAGVGLMVGGPSHPSLSGVALSLLMSSRSRRDRDHAPPARGLDGAGDVPLAGARLRVRRAVRVDRRCRPAGPALLVGLGIGQIGLGLIFLTIGARLIPAAEVALITLLEIVLGPLWVWIFLCEQPSATTIAGGAIVLAAVVIQAAGQPEEPSVPPP